jgi:hypothetical protein
MLQEVEADLKEVVQGLVDVTGRRRWEGQEVAKCRDWSRGGWVASSQTGRPQSENVRDDSDDSDGSDGSDGSVHTPSLVARWLVGSLTRSLSLTHFSDGNGGQRAGISLGRHGASQA